MELKNVSPIRRRNIFNMVALKLRGREESGIQIFLFLSRGGMGGALAIESLYPGI